MDTVVATAKLWVQGARRDLDKLEEVEPQGVREIVTRILMLLFFTLCRLTSKLLRNVAFIRQAEYLRRLRGVVDELAHLPLPAVVPRTEQLSTEASTMLATLQLLVSFPVRIDVLDEVRLHGSKC